MLSLLMNWKKCGCKVIGELCGSLRHLLLWQRALLAAFVLCLFFFSLFFSYQMFVSVYSYTPEQQEIINHLYHWGSLSSEFGVRELEHLRDVKKIMDEVTIGLVVLALVVAGLARYLYSYNLLGEGFFISGFFGIVVLLVGIGWLVLSFDWVFDVFHRSLFTSGSWMFPAQSVLIRRFPEVFFASAAKSILMLTSFMQLVFMMIGLYLFGKEKK